MGVYAGRQEFGGSMRVACAQFALGLAGAGVLHLRRCATCSKYRRWPLKHRAFSRFTGVLAFCEFPVSCQHLGRIPALQARQESKKGTDKKAAWLSPRPPSLTIQRLSHPRTPPAAFTSSVILHFSGGHLAGRSHAHRARKGHGRRGTRRHPSASGLTSRREEGGARVASFE